MLAAGTIATALNEHASLVVGKRNLLRQGFGMSGGGYDAKIKAIDCSVVTQVVDALSL